MRRLGVICLPLVLTLAACGQGSGTGAQGGSYRADTAYVDGSVDRSVDATGRSGNSYTADVTGTKGEGIARTATCHDPNGAVIPCRK